MGLFTTNTNNTTIKPYTTDGLPVNESNKDNKFTDKNNDCRSERNFQNPNCKNYGKSSSYWPFGGKKRTNKKKTNKAGRKKLNKTARKHRKQK